MLFLLSFTEAVLPYIILIVSLLLLLWYMNKYHHYEMNKISISLISFALFESIDIIAIFVEPMLLHHHSFWLFYNIELYLGGYIFLQALGIIYIKKTRDPLERISKLGFL